MKIRVTDGTAHIYWTMEPNFSSDNPNHMVAIQVDKTGSHLVMFNSADEAGAWIMEQARYAREDMGFRFTL